MRPAALYYLPTPAPPVASAFHSAPQAWGFTATTSFNIMQKLCAVGYVVRRASHQQYPIKQGGTPHNPLSAAPHNLHYVKCRCRFKGAASRKGTIYKPCSQSRELRAESVPTINHPPVPRVGTCGVAAKSRYPILGTAQTQKPNQSSATLRERVCCVPLKDSAVLGQSRPSHASVVLRSLDSPVRGAFF